ncbi:YsnF/AvaK domain-containing protein [Microbacterium paulum]
MPSRDDAAADTVRHEEHLHVHVETVATETVRIEKVVVTEQRTLTIDVRREELRITRTPLTPGESLLPPVAPRTPPPIVMILREEQPVITMKVVPVEKVTVAVTVHLGRHLRGVRTGLSMDASAGAPSSSAPPAVASICAQRGRAPDPEPRAFRCAQRIVARSISVPSRGVRAHVADGERAWVWHGDEVARLDVGREQHGPREARVTPSGLRRAGVPGRGPSRNRYARGQDAHAAAHTTHIVAKGRASSRPSGIAVPHTTHTP